LHPSGLAALRRARYTAVASRGLVVTYAHGVGAGWRAVTPAFIAAAVAPFQRDGFWLCGLAACARHMRMKECVAVAPRPQRAGGGGGGGAAPGAYVDATACDVSLQTWTLCATWVGGQGVPQPPPALSWWGAAPLAANGTAGRNTACWTLPRGRGDVSVLLRGAGANADAARVS
jgi:hypothetical protein